MSSLPPQYGSVPYDYSSLSESDLDLPPRPPQNVSASGSPPHPPPPFTPPSPSKSSYAIWAEDQPPVYQRTPPENPKPKRFQMFLIRFLAFGTTLAWTITMGGLLVAWWFIDDRELYRWYLGKMPYISDVGAVHKTFFRVGALCTSVFLVLTIVGERCLRYARVLPEVEKERWLWHTVAWVDIGCVVISCLGLIELTWFDAFNFPQLHNIFMNIFIVGIALSGALQAAEVHHLWHDHPDRRDVEEGTILKIIFLTIAIACGASFWILYAVCDGDASKSASCYKVTTASAVMEWTACALIIPYFGTLVQDVWPAYRHAPVPDPLIPDGTASKGLLPLKDGKNTDPASLMEMGYRGHKKSSKSKKSRTKGAMRERSSSHRPRESSNRSRRYRD